MTMPHLFQLTLSGLPAALVLLVLPAAAAPPIGATCAKQGGANICTYPDGTIWTCDGQYTSCTRVGLQGPSEATSSARPRAATALDGSSREAVGVAVIGAISEESEDKDHKSPAGVDAREATYMGRKPITSRGLSERTATEKSIRVPAAAATMEAGGTASFELPDGRRLRMPADNRIEILDASGRLLESGVFVRWQDEAAPRESARAGGSPHARAASSERLLIYR